jgi:hypothetical protein
MKKSFLLLAATLLLLTVLSCRTLQGIPVTDVPYLEPSTATENAPEVTEAPATDAGIVDVMSDMTGTTWTLTYYDKAVSQQYTYDLTFLAGGKLSNTHPNDNTPDNDGWEQAGNVVTIYFNDAYATYTGTISGNTISGTASNIVGSTWDWSAVLKGTGGTTGTADTNSDSDVTGTTWTMTYYDKAVGQEYTFDITFLPGGKLSNTHPNESTPDNDRWEQQGATVILYFNDAYATYTGVIDGNTITGTATNVTGSTWDWSAVLK